MNALIRSVLFCIVVVVTVLLCLNSPKIQLGNAAGVVMEFPKELPNFIGKEASPDPVELKLLPDDTQFAKATYYSDPPTDGYRDRIHASIVLSGEERTSIHRPEVCLQGQGWQLVSSRVIPIQITPERTLQVKDLAITKTATLADGREVRFNAHYLYWFVGNDVTTPHNHERILLTLKDNIFRNVNHRWAYASMMIIVNDSHEVEEMQVPRRTDAEAVKIVSDLIRQVVSKIQLQYAS